jgi:hypothetical protein
MNKFKTVKMVGWTIVGFPTILILLALWFGLTKDNTPTMRGKVDPPTKIVDIKPVLKEEPKPIVKEEPKPIVKEEPKPVVKEEPKPVLVVKDTVKVELATKPLDSLKIKQDTIND